MSENLPNPENLSPSEAISFETLKVYREHWVAAWLEGYITEAGYPNPDRFRTNTNGTLLGCQAGFKVPELEDACQFFLSGDHNRYLGALGLPRYDPDETLQWLKSAAEGRAQRKNRQRLRDKEKEPWAWISLNAAKILTRSPEVKPSTWATYSALCIQAGEQGGEVIKTTVGEISKVCGLKESSIAGALKLLQDLRLIIYGPAAFQMSSVRLLSVRE